MHHPTKFLKQHQKGDGTITPILQMKKSEFSEFRFIQRHRELVNGGAWFQIQFHLTWHSPSQPLYYLNEVHSMELESRKDL